MLSVLECLFIPEMQYLMVVIRAMNVELFLSSNIRFLYVLLVYVKKGSRVSSLKYVT